MRDGFKKNSVVMCDRYPPFATLINRIPLFPPRMKKGKKKPTQIQAAFSINIVGAAKRITSVTNSFFLEPKNKKLTSQLCI